MHYKREIDYHNYKNCNIISAQNINVSCAFTIFQDK